VRENLVKEYISESFVRLLMAKNRYKVMKPEMGDDGVDLSITSVNKRMRGKSVTYTDSGKILNIQLKCTTEKQVSKFNDGYKYNLRVKNYEDLVLAKEENYTKIILIVFILPDDEINWMEIKEDYIKLSKHAFWYYPSDTDTIKRSEYKDAKSTVSIDLLSLNRLDLDFSTIFKVFYAD
jgi:hypothetical protein